ncbi:MAG: hypothetical protein HXX16_00890 [Bacteroidales bacterium]|nr:hypothetical protein [Bacteroidales bacterium]
MRDFTLQAYTRLIESLKGVGYSFQTFQQFLEKPLEKVIILRHDVDKLPINSLKTAQIEKQLGICGSYYFRIVKESNNPEIIKEIADFGHEIGYHYEDLALVNGDIVRAIKSFDENLNYFRNFYHIKTICMHGSPLSKYDNRNIWKTYDYRSFGIIGEPYFDVDFSKVLYLTDTGRRWNGEKVSIRDKVQLTEKGSHPQLNTNYSFRHTNDIIKAVEEGRFPNQVMFTIHPQRWNDGMILWTKELISQNIKNIAKSLLNRIK